MARPATSLWSRRRMWAIEGVYRRGRAGPGWQKERESNEVVAGLIGALQVSLKPNLPPPAAVGTPVVLPDSRKNHGRGRPICNAGVEVDPVHGGYCSTFSGESPPDPFIPAPLRRGIESSLCP